MSSEFGKIIAVILAGGYGTRVKHLLPNIPKPMASVAGKPFIEWVLRYLQQQGINHSLLSTGYLAEVIGDYFASQPIEGMKVECYPETTALGTAGGFLNAVKQSLETPEAWLILNGDSLVFTDLGKLTAHLADESLDGAMLGLSVADASRYGSLLCDEQGYLLSFAEKRPGVAIINAGVFWLRSSLLSAFPREFPLGFEQDIFPLLLSQGFRFKVEVVAAPFLDIGTPESLGQAEAFIRQNVSNLNQ